MKQYETYNSVVITPLKIMTDEGLTNVLDIPFGIRYLKDFDENRNEVDLTFRDIIDKGNEYPISKDGKYIAIYLELSDLHNEVKKLKDSLKGAGLTLGGSVFDESKQNAVWYLTMTEWLGEFKDAFLGINENES